MHRVLHSIYEPRAIFGHIRHVILQWCIILDRNILYVPNTGPANFSQSLSERLLDLRDYLTRNLVQSALEGASRGLSMGPRSFTAFTIASCCA
jgi:hypothetical protein